MIFYLQIHLALVTRNRGPVCTVGATFSATARMSFLGRSHDSHLVFWCISCGTNVKDIVLVTVSLVILDICGLMWFGFGYWEICLLSMKGTQNDPAKPAPEMTRTWPRIHLGHRKACCLVQKFLVKLVELMSFWNQLGKIQKQINDIITTSNSLTMMAKYSLMSLFDNIFS